MSLNSCLASLEKIIRTLRADIGTRYIASGYSFIDLAVQIVPECGGHFDNITISNLNLSVFHFGSEPFFAAILGIQQPQRLTDYLARTVEMTRFDLLTDDRFQLWSKRDVHSVSFHSSSV